MRTALLASVGLLSACSYPEFGFVHADAGADTDVATDVIDAGPTRGCGSSTAAFCDDWDTSTSPADHWTYPSVDPGGALTLGPDARSSPNAVLASVSPGGGSVVTALLGKDFTVAAPNAKIRADVWMKLERATFPGTGAFLFKIERPGGEGVTFSMDDTGFYADRIGVTYDAYPISTAPPVGTWFHVRMEARLATVDGELTVYIDDMSTPVLAKTGVSTAKTDDVNRTFSLGLYAEDTSSTFRVHYDDVSYELLP